MLSKPLPKYVLVLLLPISLCSAAPPYQIEQTPVLRYVQRETWWDSMLASRAALIADEQAGKRIKPTVSFHGDVVRGRQPAAPISVALEGVDEIYLYVTGAPDAEYGAADWIAPRLIDSNGTATLVCSEGHLDLQQGFHTVDCSLRSRVDPPLRIADQEYQHGINVQAPGKIRIRIPPDTQRFEASIGIDDWVNPETYQLAQPYYYQPHHFATTVDPKPQDAPSGAPKGAVRFHVTDAAGAARLDLWTRLALDFSHETPRQQMKWEQEDRLLEEDWTPGDWKELALRYADACGRVTALQQQARLLAAAVTDRASLERVRAIYHHSRKIHAVARSIHPQDFQNLRDAIEDLQSEFGAEYPNAAKYLTDLDDLASQWLDATSDFRERQQAPSVDSSSDRDLHARIVRTSRVDYVASLPRIDGEPLA